MRNLTAPLALAGGIVLFAAAVAGMTFPLMGTASAITNCDTTEANLNATELDMLAAINAERARAGVAALKSSPALNRSSAWKSADRSASGATFSHTDSLGRSAYARAIDCGYPAGTGENIAYGFPSVAATVAAWMGSSGHRANILNASYKVIGIGLHGSAWTTDFGLVDDSTSGPPPSNTPNQSSPTATTPATATPSPAATATPSPTATPTTQPVYPSAGIRMDLPAGVNIVTYAGSERPASAALASLGTRVKAVYEWNPLANRWDKFVPAGPAYVSTFTALKPGHVYSIELTAAGTWVY